MSPPAITNPDALRLARALTVYALTQLPAGDSYSAGMVNRLVLVLIKLVDVGLAEYMAALELEEDE